MPPSFCCHRKAQTCTCYWPSTALARVIRVDGVHVCVKINYRTKSNIIARTDGGERANVTTPREDVVQHNGKCITRRRLSRKQTPGPPSFRTRSPYQWHCDQQRHQTQTHTLNEYGSTKSHLLLARVIRCTNEGETDPSPTMPHTKVCERTLLIRTRNTQFQEQPRGRRQSKTNCSSRSDDGTARPREGSLLVTATSTVATTV